MVRGGIYSLKERFAERFVVEITSFLLEGLKDKDERIRFAALEYLYFICKHFNELALLNFNEIFLALLHKIGEVDESTYGCWS